MKMAKRVLVLVGATLIVTVVSSPTPTGSVEVLRSSVHFAQAIFTSVDPSGCISTTVFLSAFDGMSQDPPGQPLPDEGATVVITTFDSCTFMSTFAFGTSTDVEFRHDGALRAGTLKGTVPVCSSSCFNVSVDVSWTGTGDLQRGNNNSFVHLSDGGRVIYFRSRSTDAFRPAEATGVVSDGSVNFIPSATTDAVIGFGGQHFVQVN